METKGIDSGACHAPLAGLGAVGLLRWLAGEGRK